MENTELEKAKAYLQSLDQSEFIEKRFAYLKHHVSFSGTNDVHIIQFYKHFNPENELPKFHKGYFIGRNTFGNCYEYYNTNDCDEPKGFEPTVAECIEAIDHIIAEREMDTLNL